MQNLSEFKLIDGNFSAEEATQILTALINYKIDYHNREDFSNHIRFNKDLEHSKKRVNQLIEAKDLLPALLDQANSPNLKLKINGTVTIIVES